jgi:50S ribosomal protein L16 3-hydroxylase
MLYDDAHIFINGESFLASGQDATLMRLLANAHVLTPAQTARLSLSARALLADWWDAGWLHAESAA